MKTLLSLTTGFALAALMVPGTALAGVITGSAHDFKAAAWNDTGEICVTCHAPHNDTNAAGSLLWGRTDSGETYIPYSSPTLQGDPSAGPTGVSKLCLSCHDGTVALESFVGNGAVTSTLIGTVNAAADFGSDLSNDHPISFDYTVAQGADAELNPTTATFAGGTIADVLVGGTQMECSSCHDVHNTDAVAATPLLRIDNANSDLCLACHAK